MKTDEVVLQLKNVKKLYIHDQYYEDPGLLDFIKKKDIGVEGINLIIYKGLITGITGEIKSGKSTLLKMIAGDIKPSSGCILLNGEVVDTKALKDKISCIMKSKVKNGNFSMTVFENVLHYSLRGGCNRNAAIDKSEKLIEEFGLSEFKYRDINKMLPQLKKRLFTVIGLNSHKEIICFDEPYTILEEEYWEKFNKKVEQLRDEKRKTIIISSQTDEILKNLCDNVIHMKGIPKKEE